MEGYKRWVRMNKDYLHSMESLANGLTYLLPERFSDSEIGPEAVTAFVGIVTAINEHIIETAPVQTPRGVVEPSPVPWSLCVSAIKEMETLVEVVAQQVYGEDKKWDFIVVTEAIKVFFRLALFRDSGYKMLLRGGETMDSEKASNELDLQHGLDGLARPDGHHGMGNYLGQRMQNLEGRALSALNRFGQNARKVAKPTLLTRPQQQQAVPWPPSQPPIERPTLSTVLSERGLYGGLFLMEEVLHITRPLIYVLFIRKYGVRSWTPWLLSLAMDVTGMSLLSLVKRSAPLSTLEGNEVKRRKLLWAFYLMRDPVFSKYTRQRFNKTEKLFENIPVIGFITAKAVELLTGAQSRYTYMSGS